MVDGEFIGQVNIGHYRQEIPGVWLQTVFSFLLISEKIGQRNGRILIKFDHLKCR